MPAALLVPSLIGAGASVAGAAIGAHSASSAEKAQTDAANKALALQSQIYQDQKAALQPYQQLGTDAIAGYRQYEQTPFAQQVASAASTAFQNPFSQMAAQRIGISPQQMNPGGPAYQPVTAMNGMATVTDSSGATKQVPRALAGLYQQHGFQVR